MSRPFFKWTLSSTAALTAVAAMSAGVVWLNLRDRGPTLDAAGCPQNELLIPARTVAAADQTDSFSKSRIAYTIADIEAEYRRLPLYGKLTVVGISGDPNTGEPVLEKASVCRVKLGDESNPAIENKLLLDSRARQLLETTVTPLIQRLGVAQNARYSPISEALSDLIVSEGLTREDIPRRLILYSDGMQRSKIGGVSHYPGRNAKDRVFRYTGLHGWRLAASAKGIQVRLHYVVRDGFETIQNDDHRLAWEELFLEAGATDIQIGWGKASNTNDDLLAPIRASAEVVAESTDSDLWFPAEPSTPEEARPDARPPTKSNDVLQAAPALVSPVRASPPVQAIKPFEVDVQTHYVQPSRGKGYVDQAIRWAGADKVAVDARRVLLLTLAGDPACYMTLPISTDWLAAEPRESAGATIRRWAAYPADEMRFAGVVAQKAPAAVVSTVLCEIVSVRPQGRPDDARWRGLRCGGGAYEAVADATWTELATATRGVARKRLGVRNGIHQLPSADLSAIKSALAARQLCPPLNEISAEKRVLSGLNWLT